MPWGWGCSVPTAGVQSSSAGLQPGSSTAPGWALCKNQGCRWDEEVLWVQGEGNPASPAPPAATRLVGTASARCTPCTQVMLAWLYSHQQLNVLRVKGKRAKRRSHSATRSPRRCSVTWPRRAARRFLPITVLQAAPALPTPRPPGPSGGRGEGWEWVGGVPGVCVLRWEQKGREAKSGTGAWRGCPHDGWRWRTKACGEQVLVGLLCSF